MTSEADTLKTTSYAPLFLAAAASQECKYSNTLNVSCQIQASMNGFWPLVATESEALPAVKELKHTLGSFPI